MSRLCGSQGQCCWNAEGGRPGEYARGLGVSFPEVGTEPRAFLLMYIPTPFFYVSIENRVVLSAKVAQAWLELAILLPQSPRVQ